MVAYQMVISMCLFGELLNDLIYLKVQNFELDCYLFLILSNFIMIMSLKSHCL